MRPEPIVLVVGLLALFPLQAALDATRGAPPDIIETLPPRSLLPALAMGHRETAADLLEIKATNFLLKGLDNARAFSDPYRDHMWSLYDAILALDPNDADAAWRGGLMMGAVCARPDDAIALLRRGLGQPYLRGGKAQPKTQGVHPEHPRRWRLFSEQASTYFLMHANRTFGEERRDFVRQAGKLWIKAAQAGAPEYYGQVGERLATRNFTREESLRHERLIWQHRLETGNERTRQVARERLKEVQAAFTQLELQRLVIQARRAGRTVRTLADLGVEYPPDPLGGSFGLRGARVIAPRVEARRLQRLLHYRWRVFRHRHPDRTPTPRELLRERPHPDYLDIEIGPNGPRVRAKP